MLQQVVLQNSTPMVFDIDAADPSDILIVKSISGLSGTDVTLFTGDFARDGGYYQGRRVGKRNPVLTFKLNPDYANDVEVSDIREMLYRHFYEPDGGVEAKGGVKVLLKDDRRPDRYLIGYTERIETELFSETQEVQVSMLCVDPLLRSELVVYEDDVAGWVSTPFTYDGSAYTGLTFSLWVKVNTPQVVVDLDGQQMVLEHPTSVFTAGTTIHINTNIGSRSIQILGADVMAYLADGSRWLELKGPDHVLKTYGEVESDGDVVIISYGFRSAWWGI